MGLISRVSSRTYRGDIKKMSVETLLNTENSEEQPKRVLKLRNYKPHDDTFKEAKVDQVKPTKIDSQIKDQLVENEGVVDEIGLETLQPRKPDWDLKRDLQPKLAKLNKRTQASLRSMLTNRLKEQNQANEEPEIEQKSQIKSAQLSEFAADERYQASLLPT